MDPFDVAPPAPPDPDPATTDPLMSIGAFSAATLVSIKTLRHYHEHGILVPAAIDAATGYRSYRVSQLPDAEIVKRLRSLGVPLADIAEVLGARDPEITRKVIGEHERAMRARLADVTREHYVMSTGPDDRTLLPAEQLRTEICWPVNERIPS